MRNAIIRLGCTVLYCALVAVAANLDIRTVCDWREMALVALGTVLLTLVSRPARRGVRHCAAINAVIAGLLASLIRLFAFGAGANADTGAGMGAGAPIDGTMSMVLVLYSRPLLYGFIIFFSLFDIVAGNEKNSGADKTEDMDSGTVSAAAEDTARGEESDTGRDVENTTDGAEGATQSVSAAQKSAENILKKSGLSVREEQIARMAALGLTNAQIAEELFIAPVTVKTHMAHILAKLSLSSRNEIAPLIKSHSNKKSAPITD